MGLRDRFKGLGGPSKEDVPTAKRRPSGLQDVEARLAALDKLHASGSMSRRELEQAKRRILEGKD